MTEVEARQAVKDIHAGLSNVRDRLLELYEREGWRVLGYQSWRECAQTEFSFGQSQVYRLLDAAKVERNISPMGEKPISERLLRPLVKLELEEQREVWQHVKNDNGKVTGATVQRMIEEMDIKTVSVDTQRIQIRSNNEWYTPSVYLEAARSVMGVIDVDPASSTTANENVQAATFYTKEDDGLTRRWVGRIWLNPPYGSSGPEFVAELLRQHDIGDITEAILLVNSNATETQWFAPLWDHILCFVRGRINFISNIGTRNGSTHGSVFVYLGQNQERFAEIFKEFGPIVQRVV